MRYAAIAAGVLTGLLAGPVGSAPASMDELLRQAQQTRGQQAGENRAREQRFIQERDSQRARLREVRAELAAENRRSDTLKATFETNETELEALAETLRIRLGNMGELFGVVRQIAGDVKGVIDNSLVSTQYPGRGELVAKVADSSRLPSIDELNELRVLMMREMAESGKVVRFPATVITAAGEEEHADIVRVGVFNLVRDDEFLTVSNGAIQELARQPRGRYRSLAAGLSAAAAGERVPMAVDPSRGQLLGAVIQTPSLRERVNQGGPVGYVIIAMGLFGLALALERWYSLFSTRRKVNVQLDSTTARPNNPLGRILGVYDENRDVDTETLELKLDEAILRETPRLEKRLGFIKVLAAIAPLLGLLGTVTGMIETFQMITLFGTGDPKLMAGGISTALVTTVLGLLVAIPLVVLHSILSAQSRAVTEILEEQSAGIIARHSGKGG